MVLIKAIFELVNTIINIYFIIYIYQYLLNLIY